MPLATRPNAMYEVVLSSDAELPKENQPVFIFRYLSILEWEEIARLNDKFEKAGEATEMINLAFKVIEKTLHGWRNMKTPAGKEIAFDPKRLKSMLSLPETTELMQAAVSQRPSLMDKKKFDSPSASSTAKSAKTAKE
ncbi:unnamed protein product [marine sediment metagenome]|uniref:Uncharacterized protein n=1 Tax=marine sediment metagenome TaxID=412755 RepID=X1IBZ9_9ZZZZ